MRAAMPPASRWILLLLEPASVDNSERDESIIASPLWTAKPMDREAMDREAGYREVMDRDVLLRLCLGYREVLLRLCPRDSEVLLRPM